MNTKPLEKFAQAARRQLKEQVAAKLARVLQTDSAELRGRAAAVQELKQQLDQHKRDGVIERVAYTWFNRFCALRYMDVNGFTRMGVVSPAAGFTQPELLQEAKQGHIDDDLPVDRQRVLGLLGGHLPSPDPQQEAYRLLLVATCNSYYATMPFLFERIADYTELLMPDDLLSVNSLLAGVREAMTAEACQDVEVIGWLYQFYISEKKDEVFAALKQNKKIAAADIPAATQLFTPHWIVRYLVENSLGRLWLLNRPQSRLADLMPYYIQPEQVESDFLRVTSPEELTVCDPAGGSGHMLTYAFDLLYAIYEEEGYNPPDIPRLILEKNLYGMELDERAGALAAFALTMKAREKDRRFFRRPVQPNICVLKSIDFSEGELKEYMDFIGRDLFTDTLQTTLQQFEEANNFGSLIRPAITNANSILAMMALSKVSSHLFLSQTHEKVLQVLRQVDYLSTKYHVVITNPPYMGGKGMNLRLSEWAKQNYPNSKADLFSMFMERSIEITLQSGVMGMINLPSWLFLSTFEPIRKYIIDKYSIESLLHMGRGIFGIDWGSTAFIIKKSKQPEKVSHFFRLHKRNFQHIYYSDIKTLFINSLNNHSYKYNFDGYRENPGNINEISQESNANGQQIYYRASSANFKKIPGNPIAYWFNEKNFDIFLTAKLLEEIAVVKTGMTTADNDLFTRHWNEVSLKKIGFLMDDSVQAQASGCKWFPYELN